MQLFLDHYHSIFTRPLKQIIELHKKQYQFYAEDTQLYLSLGSFDNQSVIARLNHCLVDCSAQSTANFLKLHDDETELLLIGIPKRVENIPIFQVQVGDNTVNPAVYARNLRVYFDSTLSF